MELEPTGERMIMQEYKSSPQDYLIYLLHIATYRFAEAYTQGKRVLDYGCGSGYGSAQVSRTAASVVAVDVAEEAVAYASSHFSHPNLSFQRVDPNRPLPFADASFDTVLSFQVFEHVADTGRYLAEIRRVLVPGGTLVLVTPDRSTRLLPGQKPWNRWHLHEYSKAELVAKISPLFDSLEVMGMTARADMIDVEIRRCTKLKWLSLPFTFPGIPDRWRVAALNQVHRLRGSRGGEAVESEFGFSVDDIHIGADASPSVNLVAIARTQPIPTPR